MLDDLEFCVAGPDGLGSTGLLEALPKCPMVSGISILSVLY